MMSKRRGVSLTRLFDQLNQQFFGGRLPKYNVRRVAAWSPRSMELRAIAQGRAIAQRRHPDAAARSMKNPLGVCHRRLAEIRIASHLRPDFERVVLLHEMCHAVALEEGERGHGPVFRRELARLIEFGAVAPEHPLIAPFLSDAGQRDEIHPKG